MNNRLGALSLVTLVMALVTALSTAPVAAGGATSGAPAGPPGRIVIVQAYPGASFMVSVDGKVVEQKAAVHDVLAPMDLVAGKHELTFADTDGGQDMTTTITVAPASSNDVVLHRPASTSGGPVVDIYRTPSEPVAAGMARVLLAHTATVAPADVRVDGSVVFSNIANGEFAAAEVPAGTHRVTLLPTGSTTNPLLGPLDLVLAPATVTMVYAVGTPMNGSMDVILHTVDIGSDGSRAPERVDTGSVGLVAHVRVHAFR